MSATYGVTYSTVAASGLGLYFSDSPATTPSATQCTTEIADTAIEWDAKLRSIGVDPTALHDETAQEGYTLSRRWITWTVAAWALASRVRDNPAIAQRYQDRADALWKEIKARPSTLGDTQPVATTSPNLTRGPTTGDPLAPSQASAYWSNPTRRA